MDSTMTIVSASASACDEHSAEPRKSEPSSSLWPKQHNIRYVRSHEDLTASARVSSEVFNAALTQELRAANETRVAQNDLPMEVGDTSDEAAMSQMFASLSMKPAGSCASDPEAMACQVEYMDEEPEEGDEPETGPPYSLKRLIAMSEGDEDIPYATLTRQKVKYFRSWLDRHPIRAKNLRPLDYKHMPYPPLSCLRRRGSRDRQFIGSRSSENVQSYSSTSAY